MIRIGQILSYYLTLAQYYNFSACSVQGQDDDEYTPRLTGFFQWDFDAAKSGELPYSDDADPYNFAGPEGVVFAGIQTYDFGMPVFVDGSNITKTEADIICSNDEPYLKWGAAVRWDTNKNQKYFPTEVFGDQDSYYCVRIECPEGAEDMEQCEWRSASPGEPCNYEDSLVIWCDIGDVNWFEFSLDGVKVDLGLNELIQHWLFE